VATALVAALLAFAADGPTNATLPAKKKPTQKAPPSSIHTTTRKTVAKKGKKGAAHPSAVPARSRQLSPTPDRYKEIQEALAAKGYLPPDQANGQWNDGSQAALKRFQADQNLDASGKINSLSLIALGLGPKHDTSKPGTAPATPQQP
jgi:hypothetical protein